MWLHKINVAKDVTSSFKIAKRASITYKMGRITLGFQRGDLRQRLHVHFTNFPLDLKIFFWFLELFGTPCECHFLHKN